MITEHTPTILNERSTPIQMPTHTSSLTSFRQTRRPPLLLIAILVLSTLGNSPAMATYTITQWTISSGGTTEATGGNWQLAGTIGQWEATPARALSRGQWRLTGGFWATELSELGDLIFRDRFKRANLGPSSLQSGQQAPNQD